MKTYLLKYIRNVTLGESGLLSPLRERTSVFAYRAPAPTHTPICTLSRIQIFLII